METVILAILIAAGIGLGIGIALGAVMAKGDTADDAEASYWNGYRDALACAPSTQALMRLKLRLKDYPGPSSTQAFGKAMRDVGRSMNAALVVPTRVSPRRLKDQRPKDDR